MFARVLKIMFDLAFNFFEEGSFTVFSKYENSAIIIFFKKKFWGHSYLFSEWLGIVRRI